MDAVQLFDSWAGALSLRDYRTYVLPHSARVLAAPVLAGVPRIHFGVGTGELLAAMGEAGADVVGVDWRVPLDEAARRTGGTRALQGNLDPAVLFADAATVEAEVRRIVAEGRAAPGHVFNLGHGVLPGTDPDVLTRVVDLVHGCDRSGHDGRPARRAGRPPRAGSGAVTRRVAVVGGGVSGLAAAHRLRALLPTAAITVLEQRDRVGGVLRTVDLAGVPVDVGAEAFLARRPEVPALLDELGLRGELVHPGPAAPTVRAGGVTVPLPPGTLLGVPTGAARLDGVLSSAAVARAAAERERPLRWTPGVDVGLGGLLRERFGDEVADRLADPLLGGVYAGRVDALGLRATLPTLAAELDAGAPSLTAAADRAVQGPASSASHPGEFPAPTGRVPRSARPAPVFGALRGGYATARRRPRRDRGRPPVDDGPGAAPPRRRLAARPRAGAGRARRRRRRARRPGPRRRPAAGRRRTGGRPRRGGDRAGLVRGRRAGLPGGGHGRPAGHVRGPGRRRRASVDQGGDALLPQVAAPRAVGDGRARAAAGVARPVRGGGDAAGRRRRAGRPGPGRPRRAGRDHRGAGRGARAAVGRRPAAVRGRAPRPGAGARGGGGRRAGSGRRRGGPARRRRSGLHRDGPRGCGAGGALGCRVAG